jgi:hypothetical protein
MRVEVAHNVADDLGRLLECCSRVEAQQAHPVQDTAVHRLETVARIGQSPIHDRGEGVCKVALFQRLPQRNLFNVTFFGGNQSLSHA